PHAPSDNARLNAAFGRCSLIHLQRDDTLNQAISLLRAEQTGLWHRNADGSELEREAPRREAGYDRAAISAHIDRISQQNREWAAWFKEEGLRPLHLSYEKLSSAPGHELARVFAHIGLDPAHAENVSTQTSRLADDVSANWRARYLAEDRL
ncbi:MAG: Stf0 family sulfotransferase, partial [Pseudomonadota bacterium]